MRERPHTEEDVDLTPHGVSDAERNPMSDTSTNPTTAVVRGGSALPDDALPVVGRASEVLGVDGAAAFFTERLEARVFHYNRMRRTLGQPRGGRIGRRILAADED